MNGVPVAGHIGRTALEITPELFPVFAPSLNQALQGEAITDVEVRQAAHGDQNEKTFLVSYQPARDEAGEVVGVSVAVLDFTARKKAEELRQQYERVVEGLEEMIAVVDRDYRFVLANRAFLDYLGLNRTHLIGRPVTDAIEKDVFESTIKPKLEKCFQGDIVKFELTYNFPTFGERDLSIAYYPVEVAGGITGAAWVLRDLTEINQMALANQNWQKRIDLAQRSGLRIGLWDWDIAANTVVWSDETYRQWGYLKNEFRGRVESAVTRIHPGDLPTVQHAIDEVLSGEKHQYACQYRVLRPDGSTCWIDASGVIVRNGSTHMIGVGIDVTALKTVEQSLQESEEKYRLLLNSTAEAIYGLDLEGNCTFCNPAGLRSLGFGAQEDLLGRNMHHAVHHTRKDGVPYALEECAIFTAIRSGLGTHCDTEVMWRSDGTSFPVEYWSYPMFKGGQLVGAVVTFLERFNRGESKCEATTLIEASRMNQAIA
jgi:PAS domain S-box-containing protein